MAYFEVHNISKSFDGVNALNDFSIEIEKNQIVGIIGPNGAGKTTAFNVISGIYPSGNGEIILDGIHLEGKKQHEIAKAGISRTFQNIRLFSGMNVIENVMAAGDYRFNYDFFSSIFSLAIKRKKEKENLENSFHLLKLLGLEEYYLLKANELSYGIQRKVEIARALALNPKLLMLDEPAAGLNPNEAQEFTQIIRSIKDEFGISVLIIEHHMDVVMNLCDYMYVLDFGQQIAEGTPEQIKNNEDVLKAYLGEDEE